MVPRQLSPDQFQDLVSAYSTFLLESREAFWVRSLPLEDSVKTVFRGFFAEQLLDNLRVHELREETLRPPGFYPLLAHWGFRDLPDFSSIEAITFLDLIVFSSSLSQRTLFHEMVHAEQFRQFGLDGFSRLYVGGFLKGGTYEAIPLEIQAYGLGAQFETDPRRPFSVEEEVRRWMHEGRF